MKIKFKNHALLKIVEMLLSVEVKAPNAVAVSKITELINQKNNEYADNNDLLIKKYCQVDENGNVKVDEKGVIVTVDNCTTEEFVQARNELANEVCIIDLTEYSQYLKKIKLALDETTTSFSGANLSAYASLYEQIEGVEASAVY